MIFPNNIELVYQRAKQFCDKGNYVQALIEFYHVVDNSLLDNNPDKFESHQISKDIEITKKQLRLETQNRDIQVPTPNGGEIIGNSHFAKEYEYELPCKNVNKERYYLNFGKFEGHSIKTVLKIQPSYLIWCITNVYGFCVSEEIIEILRKKGLNIDQIENLNLYNLKFARNSNPTIKDTEGITFKQFVTNNILIEDGYCIEEELDCIQENLIDLNGIEKYSMLRIIYAGNNQLTELPNLSTLQNLQVLDLAHNKLRYLPDISLLKNLKELYIGDNLLNQLPNLSSLTKLEVLSVQNNQLTHLPDFSVLSNLKKLMLEGNQLSELPDLSGLHNLQVLKLNRNQFKTITNISHLSYLKELHCYSNKLTRMPDLSNFRQLKCLSCGSNYLTELPNLSTLKYLQTLIVCNNSLTIMPDLSNLIHLGFLDCSRNKLRELPDLTNLSNLVSLDCRFNKIFEEPDLSSLKNIKTYNGMKVFKQK